jgi:sarcosine oxidase subunit delta
VLEWWLHGPSSYWFIAERHNASDEIIRTYPADELFTQRVDFQADEADA